MCCFNPNLPVSNQSRNTQVDENTFSVNMYGQELSLHGLWLPFTMLLAKPEDHWFGKERKSGTKSKIYKIAKALLGGLHVTGGSPKVLLSCVSVLLSLGPRKWIYLITFLLLVLFTHLPACFFLCWVDTFLGAGLRQ